MKDFKAKARRLAPVDRKLRWKYLLYMKRCPGCRALVGHNASKCWRCGEELKHERGS